MRGKLPLLFALLAACILIAAPAHAGSRDAAAEKKIQDAIYTHFLNMDFDTAEGLLVGTYRACEDKCDPNVRARIWMYVGIVRGSGRQDLSGAEEAFRQAFQEDAGIQLDAEIATPDVKDLFARLQGELGGGGGGGGGGGKSRGGGGMRCSLDVSEVEVRRPIPIECESDEDLDKAKLYYKNFKVDWTSVTMKPEAGLWRGTIPCSVTNSTGGLKWYVVGYDSDGDEADSRGDKDSPEEVEIVAKSGEAPPAFPDEEPPKKCDIADIGPESGGGGACAGWGGSCGGGGCCETGLVCLDGICEQEQCERNSDCPGGAECVDGKCEGEGEDGGGGGDYAKNYIGLGFAIDLATISSNGACTDDSRANDSFTCNYGNGANYDGAPNNNFGGQIGGGFTPSTMRILASYDRLIGKLDVGARIGFAFNGGPNLLPVHAGVSVGYWFLGDFSTSGPRLGVHAGGGLAQVDATVDVDVKDCSARNPNGDVQVDPTTGETLVDQTCVDSPDSGVVTKLRATKQLGLTFIEAGASFMYAFGANHGPLVNLNALIMLPSSGFVIQPTVGYAIGF